MGSDQRDEEFQVPAVKQEEDSMAVWVFVFRQPKPDDPDEQKLRAEAQLRWLEQWKPSEETIQ